MFKRLETCLGLDYPNMIDQWVMDDEFDGEDTAQIPLSPTPGPKVVKPKTPISKIETAGSGVFGTVWRVAWKCRTWGHLDFMTDGDAQHEDSSKVFPSIPGPLQTVQRTELWGVIHSLKPFVLLLKGIDNRNVFNFVSKLSDGSEWFNPLPLHEDGNYIACIQGILAQRGRSTVKVPKVKDHANDEMVGDGTVRWQDKVANDAASRAADLGGRRQPEHTR